MKRKKVSLKSYDEWLIASLSNADEAALYLNAALEEGDIDLFLLALRNVAKARGVSKLSKKSGLNRENIYRILSKRGNPRLSSLEAILSSLGLKLSVGVSEGKAA